MTGLMRISNGQSENTSDYLITHHKTPKWRECSEKLLWTDTTHLKLKMFNYLYKAQEKKGL